MACAINSEFCSFPLDEEELEDGENEASEITSEVDLAAPGEKSPISGKSSNESEALLVATLAFALFIFATGADSTAPLFSVFDKSVTLIGVKPDEATIGDEF